MGTVHDARPALLTRHLQRCGLPPHEAQLLVATLELLEDNASRYAAARAALRAYGYGPTWTRELLQAFGYWAPECCAREGCGRAINSRTRCWLRGRAAYCSPCCVLDALGIAS